MPLLQLNVIMKFKIKNNSVGLKKHFLQLMRARIWACISCIV